MRFPKFIPGCIFLFSLCGCGVSLLEEWQSLEIRLALDSGFIEGAPTSGGSSDSGYYMPTPSHPGTESSGNSLDSSPEQTIQSDLPQMGISTSGNTVISPTGLSDDGAMTGESGSGTLLTQAPAPTSSQDAGVIPYSPSLETESGTVAPESSVGSEPIAQNGTVAENPSLSPVLNPDPGAQYPIEGGDSDTSVPDLVSPNIPHPDGEIVSGIPDPETSPGNFEPAGGSATHCPREVVKVKLNSVCSRSKLASYLFYEHTVRPLLTVEARTFEGELKANPRSQFKAYFASAAPFAYAWQREQKATLLKSVDLARENLFGPKFQKTLTLDYSGVNALSPLPRGQRKILVTVYACDDTNGDGRCSDEPMEKQISIQSPTHQACRFPSALALDLLTCE